MNRISIIIALGSNLGDLKSNLDQAIVLLDEHPKIEIQKISSYHSSEALTLKGEIQDDYLNACLVLESSLTAQELLLVIQTIEVQMGRVRDKKWEARIIDLDIIDYAGKMLESEILALPHPELEKRLFVLEPLQEVMPDWRHPISGKRIDELIKNCQK